MRIRLKLKSVKVIFLIVVFSA
jgi:hypothetical protein